MAIKVNGGTAPDIPSEILAEYPKCLIRLNSTGTTYNLIAGKQNWYIKDNSIYIKDNGGTYEEYVQYDAELSAEEWTFKTSYSDNGNYKMAGGIVWANHDIYDHEGVEVLFPKSEEVTDTEPLPPEVDGGTRYAASAEWWSALADEARRLTETTNQKTHEDMLSDFQGLTIPDDTGGGGGEVLPDDGGGSATASPNAEDFYFGGTTSSFGFADTLSPFIAGNAYSGSTYCNVFIPQTDFEVIGFRTPDAKTFRRWFRLWDIDGNLLASGDATTGASEGEWTECYLGEPVQLSAGIEYVVGIYSVNAMPMAKKGKVQPNEKIVLTKYGSYSGLGFPTTFNNLANSSSSKGEIAPVDIIIGEFEEMPEAYLVSADTMNSIAAAIQTYVGAPASYSMTPAQMVSTLIGL